MTCKRGVHGYLACVVSEQEHFVAGCVGDCAQFAVAGVHVVRELVTRLSCQNVLGGNVLTKSVEDVNLLCLWRINLVFPVCRWLRYACYDRPYPGT